VPGGNGGEPGRPGAPPDPGERFVTLARCSTATVADFVRSVLDQAGIESVLQDQYLSQMFSFLSRPIGGVRVQVRLRDLPAAIEALRRPPEPLAPDAEPPGAPAASLALPRVRIGARRVHAGGPCGIPDRLDRAHLAAAVPARSLDLHGVRQALARVEPAGELKLAAAAPNATPGRRFRHPGVHVRARDQLTDKAS